MEEERHREASQMASALVPLVSWLWSPMEGEEQMAWVHLDASICLTAMFVTGEATIGARCTIGLVVVAARAKTSCVEIVTT